jgi:hypothetical protein
VKAVFLSRDLVFVSRARGAADRFGLELEVVAEADDAMSSCRSEGVGLLIVDLACVGDAVEQLLPRLAALCVSPRRVVCYAAHVREDLLASARRAGCREILTRGQFDRQMETILEAAAGSSA